MATAQVKSKQFESQNLVFSPGTWIQKYATTPQIVKKVPSLLHGAVEPGAARRLRRGRAAAAPRPGGHRAAAGPRAPRDAHRGEQLGVRSDAAGEVQRGAADVLCCRHRGGWMVLHFVLGKGAGKQQPHFLRSSQNFVIYTEVR